MFINTNISNLITVLQDCDHDPQKDEAMDLSPQRGMWVCHSAALVPGPGYATSEIA